MKFAENIRINFRLKSKKIYLKNKYFWIFGLTPRFVQCATVRTDPTENMDFLLKALEWSLIFCYTKLYLKNVFFCNFLFFLNRNDRWVLRTKNVQGISQKNFCRQKSMYSVEQFWLKKVMLVKNTQTSTLNFWSKMKIVIEFKKIDFLV